MPVIAPIFLFAQILSTGNPLERDLPAGQTHSYTLSLPAGQLVRWKLEGKGAAVVATLRDPSGQPLLTTSFAFYAIPPVAGDYQLELKTADSGSSRYNLQLLETRQPADADRIRLAAAQAYWNGEKERRDRKFAEAEAAFLEAASLWQQAADPSFAVRAWVAAGQTAQIQGHGDRALGHFEKALSLNSGDADPRGQSSTLYGLGISHLYRFELQDALDFLERSRVIRQRVEDRFQQALAAQNAGVAAFYLGDFDRALRYYNEAGDSYAAANDQPGAGYSMLGKASVYQTTGEAQKALDTYSDLVAHWRKLKDRANEARTLNDAGHLHFMLGNDRQALDYYQRALATRLELKDTAGLAETRNNLGLLYTSQRRTAPARENLEEAIRLARAGKQTRSEAYALQNLGHLYALEQQNEKARELYRQSLALKQSLHDRYGEAYTHHSLGELALASGNREQAREDFNRALTMRREAADRPGEAQTLAALARVNRDLHNGTEALEQISSALQLVETSRSNIANRDLQVKYFATRRSYYDFAVEVAAGSGHPDAALEFSERAHARALLDGLREAHVDLSEGVDPQLLTRQKGTEQRIQSQAALLWQLSPAQAERTRRQLDALLSEAEEIRARIRTASPHYAALAEPQPVHAREIRATLRDGSLFLEYTLGDERSFLLLSTAARTSTVTLPPRARIEAAARRLHEILNERNRDLADESPEQRAKRIAAADAAFPQAAASLSALILPPQVHTAGLGVRRLILVPDGILQNIPFSALSFAGTAEPLVSTYEVVALPSASVLLQLRGEAASRRPKPKTLAVFADPVFEPADPRLPSPATGGAGRETLERLRFSRLEADRIASLLVPASYVKTTDFDANLARFRAAALGDFRILHLATHAILNPTQPELSGVALSLYDASGRPREGLLRLHEIYRLKLPIELVVLSGCQTALGNDIPGEGLLSLTRGFFHAGAARVLASMWSVQDRATAELMTTFYRGLLLNHLPPAAALRAAQQKIRSQPGWASPYYWAGFTLQGEWR